MFILVGILAFGREIEARKRLARTGDACDEADCFVAGTFSVLNDLSNAGRGST